MSTQLLLLDPGRPTHPAAPEFICAKCIGTFETPCRDCAGDGECTCPCGDEHDCGVCEGSGMIPCGKCEGTGSPQLLHEHDVARIVAVLPAAINRLLLRALCETGLQVHHAYWWGRGYASVTLARVQVSEALAAEWVAAGGEARPIEGGLVMLEWRGESLPDLSGETRDWMRSEVTRALAERAAS